MGKFKICPTSVDLKMNPTGKDRAEQPLKLIQTDLDEKQSKGFLLRLEFIQIIDRLPKSDCKDLCTNFTGRKSLHDHSLKTVKICVPLL